MGSLTQWISVCQCGLIETAGPQEHVPICANCGKRVPERNSGSFTQWVFRSHLCDCEKPQPVDASHDAGKKSTVVDETPSTEPAKQFLDLPAETFPVERYRPVRKLGSGAGGTVYLCWDQHLTKFVSVKVLINRSSSNLVAFQKEAKVTARFQHPNVVSILDFGVTDGGAPYMVLEYVDGITLEQVILEDDEFVPESVAVSLFIQIADALQHGHESGVFHRDVKSSNILVTDQGTSKAQVRVIDFGVAALLGADQESTEFQGRTVVGTPKYMSPDQVKGKKYDARSEIYSFGCVMYETITGALPFNSDTAIELLKQHENEPVPRFADVDDGVDVTDELEALIRKCLEKDPDARFQTMKSLKTALQKLESDYSQNVARQQDSTGDEEPEEEMPAASRDKWVLFAVVGTIVSLIPVLVLIFMPVGQQPTAKEVEKQEKKRDESYKVRERIELSNVEQPLGERASKFDFVHTGTRFYQALAKSMVVDEDLAELKGNKAINSVNVHRREIEGPGLAYITDLPIEALDLNETPIKDDALDHVAKLKKLNYLHMQGCMISDASLKKLQGLPIIRLGLGKTDISIEGLKNLTPIKTIETLELADTPRVDATALKVLHDLPKLTKIFVSCDKNKTEEFYKELGTFKNARLFVSGDNISLKNLGHLDVAGIGFRGVRMTKPHIEVLKKMKNLEWVEFWQCGITDELMPEVARMKISGLSLCQEPITNQGLAELKQNKSLNLLEITCPKVSSSAIAILQQSNPHLEIATFMHHGFEKRRGSD